MPGFRRRARRARRRRRRRQALSLAVTHTKQQPALRAALRTAAAHTRMRAHLRGGEAREQLCLELLEADRVAVELGHERALRVLQVGALVADDEREQLVLQALWGLLGVWCVWCVRECA